jgi:hypothetical protein
LPERVSLRRTAFFHNLSEPCGLRRLHLHRGAKLPAIALPSHR